MLAYFPPFRYVWSAWAFIGGGYKYIHEKASSPEMKLHRMIALEAQGPIPLGMTLDEIIAAGKVTNNYQSFVLGQLSEFFKNKSSNGDVKSLDFQLETPIDFESRATSTSLVNAIRALTPEQAVALAQYLKDCIQVGESALRDRDMDVVAWMHYVLQSQR